MITNKDLSIDSENGKITLNGNKYDLGTQGEIDTAVKDVYSVMGQMGAKNLIIYPYYDTTKTANGITFTDNGDGTVTVNGTATGNVNFWFIKYEEDFIFPEGKYILSDGGVGNSNVSLFLANYNDSTWKRQYEVNGNGEIAVTVQHSGDYNRTPIGINVKTGTTVNNLTFKPMLRLASDTDNTYEPYAMTNKQLTDQVAEVKGTIGDITQTGITGADVAAQLAAVYDNITPQTSGEWKWIELPGNLVIMWCNHNFGEIGNLVQEGPFYKANVDRLTYPITFASVPGVWAQKIGNGQGLIIGTGDGGTTTQTPDFTIGRYTSSTLIYGCTLAYFVVGIKATT